MVLTMFSLWLFQASVFLDLMGRLLLLVALLRRQGCHQRLLVQALQRGQTFPQDLGAVGQAVFTRQGRVRRLNVSDHGQLLANISNLSLEVNQLRLALLLMPG
jgi:hypothetical protein